VTREALDQLDSRLLYEQAGLTPADGTERKVASAAALSSGQGQNRTADTPSFSPARLRLADGRQGKVGSHDSAPWRFPAVTAQETAPCAFGCPQRGGSHARPPIPTRHQGCRGWLEPQQPPLGLNQKSRWGNGVRGMNATILISGSPRRTSNAVKRSWADGPGSGIRTKNCPDWVTPATDIA
jgi:hypothetical protein